MKKIEIVHPFLVFFLGLSVLIIYFWVDYFLSHYFQTPIIFNSINKHTQMEYNLKGKFALILLWTKTYFILESHYLTQHIQCGPYKCQISRNRSLLPHSDLVVFNARYAKGLYFSPWQLILCVLFTF